jgi:flagellar assembly protein FliH
MSESTNNPKGRVISDGGETAFERWELPSIMAADQYQRIQKEAHGEGFEAGRKEGLAKAQAESEALVGSLRSILNTLSTPLSEMDDQIESELVQLAIIAARHVLRREVKTDAAQILAAVREAMGVLPVAARNVRLHLHPEDAAIVRERMNLNEGETAWRIVEDPSMSRGGCVVHTETSRIDASVESRLAAVMAAMLGGERSDDRR